MTVILLRLSKLPRQVLGVLLAFGDGITFCSVGLTKIALTSVKPT